MGTVQFMTLFLKALKDESDIGGLPYDTIDDKPLVIQELTKILEGAHKWTCEYPCATETKIVKEVSPLTKKEPIEPIELKKRKKKVSAFEVDQEHKKEYVLEKKPYETIEPEVTVKKDIALEDPMLSAIDLLSTALNDPQIEQDIGLEDPMLAAVDLLSDAINPEKPSTLEKIGLEDPMLAAVDLLTDAVNPTSTLEGIGMEEPTLTAVELLSKAVNPTSTLEGIGMEEPTLAAVEILSKAVNPTRT